MVTKVITEERLRELKSSLPDNMSKLFIQFLISDCKEIDTLIVSKLRPMCEAKDFKDDIQVFYSGEYRQSGIYYWDELSKYHYDIEPIPLDIDDDYMLGFIPTVKYKP